MPDKESVCPYVGLQPYKEEQSKFFFGRDNDIRIVAANLYACPLTVLFGPSGVGKSSLLHAGVVPYLHKSPRTTTIIFGAWNSTSFLQALKSTCVKTLRVAGCKVRLDPAAELDDLVASAAADLEETVIILLDQFEEYLLYHAGTQRGDEFEAEIARAINRTDVDAAFLLSLRDDALSRLDYLRARIPSLLGNTIGIEHLSLSGAEDAIRKPLEAYNAGLSDPARAVSVEDGLVSLLLQQVRTGKVRLDLSSGAGAPLNNPESDRIETPFLQLVLTRLWEEETREGSRVLRAKTVDRLGGAAKIVRSHLQRILAGLSEQESEICGKIFPYLVTPSGGKIAQTTVDLISWSGNPPTRVAPLLRKLSQNRVLCRTDLPERYEIFHDILAPGILEWRAKRQARRKLMVALEMMIALLLVMSFAMFLLYQRQVRVGREVLAHRLASAAIHNLEFEDPQVGLLLAMYSARATSVPSSEALTALQRAVGMWRTQWILKGHSAGIRQVVYSPDGSLLATASLDKTARIWSAADGKLQLTLTGHTGQVWGVRFSPDGATVATASSDRTVRLWNAKTGALIRELKGHQGKVSTVAFSPDGKWLATAGEDESVKLWNVKTGQILWSLDRSVPVNSVAFSPDSTLLAVAGADESPALLDVLSKREIRKLSGFPGEVMDICFSPDGRRIATGGVDATARVWDTGTGTQVLLISGHTNTVSAVAFSSDGSRLGTASFDKSARVWDSTSGRELFALRGHNETATGIAFHPAGTMMATSSFDGTVRVWGQPNVLFHSKEPVVNVAWSHDGALVAAATLGAGAVLHDLHSQVTTRLRGDYGPISSVAFNPADTLVAGGTMDGNVTLWNRASAEQVLVLNGHEDAVTGVGFKDGGNRVVSVSRDHTIRTWDVHSGALLKPLIDSGTPISALAISGDAHRVGTAGLNGVASLWNMDTGKLLHNLVGHTNMVFAIAFSPDGTRIATGGADGAARIWNADSGGLLVSLFGHRSWVIGAAFTPDGKSLATASADGTIKIWDVSTGMETLHLQGQSNKVYSVAFSRDGARLLAGDDQTARLFALRFADLMKAGQAGATRSLTADECVKYFESGTCPPLF